LPRPPRRTDADAGGEPARLFVDSSAWIALFSGRDQHHAEADAAFRVAVGRRARLLTSNLVLAEVHRFLLFRAGPRAALAALDRIEASPTVSVEFATADHHRIARTWLDRLSNHPISYTDAMSFAVTEAARCSAVISFDRDFLIGGFSLWRAES
jgi:predicted nucleic acid-binding protein